MVKAAEQKQNMIIINGRQAFVNKRKRHLKTKTISSGDKARNLPTASSLNQGIRAVMQEFDLSKDQDVNERKNAKIKLEKTRKELEMRKTEQMKEAIRKDGNVEQEYLKMNQILREKKKHEKFLVKKRANSSINAVSANFEVVQKEPHLFK